MAGRTRDTCPLRSCRTPPWSWTLPWGRTGTGQRGRTEDGRRRPDGAALGLGCSQRGTEVGGGEGVVWAGRADTAPDWTAPSSAGPLKTARLGAPSTQRSHALSALRRRARPPPAVPGGPRAGHPERAEDEGGCRRARLDALAAPGRTRPPARLSWRPAAWLSAAETLLPQRTVLRHPLCTPLFTHRGPHSRTCPLPWASLGWCHPGGGW